MLVAAVQVGGEGGPEAAARRARYDALDAAAARVGADAVLLGHTKDDQAETVLLGLARGSGVRSLAGMPAARGIYRRPLLGVARAVVRAAVPEGAPLVEDPHNADPRYARARVRHDVLPILERELGPGVVEALARTARLAREDADALDALALEGYAVEGDGSVLVESLVGVAPALVSRRVRAWLIASGVPQEPLTADHVWRVSALVTDWHGQGAVRLPSGAEALRDCGRLRVRPAPVHEET